MRIGQRINAKIDTAIGIWDEAERKLAEAGISPAEAWDIQDFLWGREELRRNHGRVNRADFVRGIAEQLKQHNAAEKES